MSFELLSAPVRKYVFDKKWKSLRPIQNAAIEKIMQTDLNYILASRTASGKTEAAFLPILSKADFTQKGVQVLYISPLIALINDQFVRVDELCEYLDVPVIRWHGEASQSQKNNMIKDPKGIILITPESVEAMLANSQKNARALFGKLRFVIIDEVHSFMGTERGIQLSSLLHRLQLLSGQPFQIIGLSATIGDYTEAKQITNNEQNTKVLLDKTPRETEVKFKYFESTAPDYSPEMIEELYRDTGDHKVLVFPNSRGKTEEVAVRLERLSKKRNGHSNYFTHHSSIDKSLREYIESFAKKNQHENFCIACTSTLELGIDIGSVDLVIQIDATYSIASMIQRVGRSGRRDGGKGLLTLYATNPWSLLQGIACWSLYQQGFIERLHRDRKPYDLLLHQFLSLIKQKSGETEIELIEFARNNSVFSNISQASVIEIIQHLLATDMLKKVGNELIIGITGEKWVNHYEFYSVFVSQKGMKVVHEANVIGEIPESDALRVDENILLAARIWKIVDVDWKGKKIKVKPTNDGKKPIFGGEPGNVDPAMRERMLRILMSTDEVDDLNDASATALNIIRDDFAVFNITDLKIQRPAIIEGNSLTLYTFTGTKINRSVSFILSCLDVAHILSDSESKIMVSISKDELIEKSKQYSRLFDSIDAELQKGLTDTSAIIEKFKWAKFLPVKYQAEVLKNRYYDFDGAKIFLNEVNWIFVESE